PSDKPAVRLIAFQGRAGIQGLTSMMREDDRLRRWIAVETLFGPERPREFDGSRVKRIYGPHYWTWMEAHSAPIPASQEEGEAVLRLMSDSSSYLRAAAARAAADCPASAIVSRLRELTSDSSRTVAQAAEGTLSLLGE